MLPVARTNFAGHTNAATLAGFEIPNDAWGPSVFAGGTFAIYVAPEITNAANCYKFGNLIQMINYCRNRYTVCDMPVCSSRTVRPRKLTSTMPSRMVAVTKIAVGFVFYRTGGFDLGCAFRAMDPKS